MTAAPPVRAVRPPPHSTMAETALLAAIMLEQSTLPLVASVVRPEHFYTPAHQQLYTAALELSANGQPYDANSIGLWLQARGALARVGGVPYIGRVIDEAPPLTTDAQVMHCAQAITSRWRLRAIATRATRLAEEAMTAEADPDAFFERAAAELLSLTTSAATQSTHAALKDVLRSAFEGIEERARLGGARPGVSWGMRKLDELTGGMRKGCLYVAGGRPGMGKTALISTASVAVCEDPAPNDDAWPAVLVFSAEMPNEELGIRYLSSLCGISSARILSGAFAGEDRERAMSSTSWLGSQPIYLDDRAAPTLEQVRLGIQRTNAILSTWTTPDKRPIRVRMVAVDYLQLMRGPRDKNGTREQEINALTMGLKNIAKSEKVSVLALSQLNRSLETRSDKRPTMADLRESGGIEQAADAILLLYRDGYYNPDGPAASYAEINIAKNRGGKTGLVVTKWHGETTSYSDLSPEDEAEALSTIKG